MQARDRYGRLLAYVWLPDGRMLNGEIIRESYAQVLTVPPNVRYERLPARVPVGGAREWAGDVGKKVSEAR